MKGRHHYGDPCQDCQLPSPGKIYAFGSKKPMAVDFAFRSVLINSAVISKTSRTDPATPWVNNLGPCLWGGARFSCPWSGSVPGPSLEHPWIGTGATAVQLAPSWIPALTRYRTSAVENCDANHSEWELGGHGAEFSVISMTPHQGSETPPDSSNVRTVNPPSQSAHITTVAFNVRFSILCSSLRFCS